MAQASAGHLMKIHVFGIVCKVVGAFLDFVVAVDTTDTVSASSTCPFRLRAPFSALGLAFVVAFGLFVVAALLCDLVVIEEERLGLAAAFGGEGALRSFGAEKSSLIDLSFVVV